MYKEDNVKSKLTQGYASIKTKLKLLAVFSLRINCNCKQCSHRKRIIKTLF